MDIVIAENTSIWTEDHNEYVLGIICGTNPLKYRSDYRFIKEYKIIRLGGVDRIARKSNFLNMATKPEAPVILRNSHVETGHGVKK